MPQKRVQIISGRSPTSTRVLVDGVEIGPIHSIDIKMRPRQAVLATITLEADVLIQEKAPEVPSAD